MTIPSLLGRPIFNFTPEQRNVIENIFAPPGGGGLKDFQQGLRYVSPNFGGRYGRILERNPSAVQSAYERANVQRPNLGALDFLESDFNPENFAASLTNVERGDQPELFLNRRRFLRY